MKKIFFAIAALATMSANAQVVKIFQNTDSQPVTFRNPSSVLFCTDADDFHGDPSSLMKREGSRLTLHLPPFSGLVLNTGVRK